MIHPRSSEALPERDPMDDKARIQSELEKLRAELVDESPEFVGHAEAFARGAGYERDRTIRLFREAYARLREDQNRTLVDLICGAVFLDDWDNA